MRRTVVAAAAWILATACASDRVDGRSGDRKEEWGPGSPRTYSGSVSCEGCPEFGLTLTLFEDGTFRERRVEGGSASGRVAHDLGRWSGVGEGALILRGTLGLREVSVTADTLEVISVRGDASGPAAPYSLARSPEVDPVEDLMRVQGMMATFPDGRLFTECGTGVPHRIVPGEAASVLERAHLDAQAEFGDPVLVELTGRLLRTYDAERGPADELVVERLERTLAGTGCDASPQDRPIERTEWALVELPGGVVVPEDAGVGLRLEPEGRIAYGSTGCGRFDGTYDLTGPRLVVAPGTIAQRGCARPELAPVARDFLEALRVTGSARVVGDRMELIGEVGVVARLRARD